MEGAKKTVYGPNEQNKSKNKNMTETSSLSVELDMQFKFYGKYRKTVVNFLK